MPYPLGQWATCQEGLQQYLLVRLARRLAAEAPVAISVLRRLRSNSMAGSLIEESLLAIALGLLGSRLF